jgi:hypothetical protein
MAKLMTPPPTSNTAAKSESPAIFRPPLLGSAEALGLAVALLVALILALPVALMLEALALMLEALALMLEALALMLALLEELAAQATGASSNTATKHSEVSNNNLLTNPPFHRVPNYEQHNRTQYIGLGPAQTTRYVKEILGLVR